MKKPLTGYGYGALWFPTDATIWVQQSLTDFTWVVFHAHNGLLQVASELGLPLACVALLMVAQQLIEIFYCQYEKQQVGVLFVLGFVIAYLVSNFSEARFLVNRELYWIFFLALPISMLRQINVVSADNELGEVGMDGAMHSVPGKPWLNPRGGASATTAMAGGSLRHVPARHEPVQAPSLALDSADIDLGVSGDVVGDAELEQASSYDSDLSGGTLDTTSDHGVVVDYGFDDEYDSLDDNNLDRYEKSFDGEVRDDGDILDTTQDHDDTLRPL